MPPRLRWAGSSAAARGRGFYSQIGSSLGYRIVHQEVGQWFTVAGVLAGLLVAGAAMLLGTRLP